MLGKVRFSKGQPCPAGLGKGLGKILPAGARYRKKLPPNLLSEP